MKIIIHEDELNLSDDLTIRQVYSDMLNECEGGNGTGIYEDVIGKRIEMDGLTPIALFNVVKAIEPAVRTS